VEKTPRKFPVLPVAIIAIVLIAGAASWIIYTRVIRHKAGIQRAVAPAAGIAQTKEAAGGSLTSSAPGDTTKQKNQQETAVASSSSKVLLQVGSEEETRDVNPRNPAKLRLNKQTMIVRITTDHYNQGKGTEFTGTISIRDNNGREAGTYSAVGKPGKNGAANSYWVVEPRRILPAGIYYIWDSNLATWSKTASGDAFVVVEGYVTE
jgi:hypothetical protein